MPRFFFDFCDNEHRARDNEGCDFADLDAAYLDAYRSMVRIGAELLLEQRDPSRQWIEILDDGRTNLMTVAFDEVFCRRGGRPPAATVVKSQLERTRRLRAELNQQCATVRSSIETARETLKRVNTTAWSWSGFG